MSSPAVPAAEAMVRVNGEDVTDRMLDGISLEGNGARAGYVNADSLNAMVDQTLLAQRALASDLDLDPYTARALDNARAQVLAQAAIRSAAGRVAVSAADVKAYYEAHPALFSRRKIYAFNTFVLDGATLDSRLRLALEVAESPAQVSSILMRAGLAFVRRIEVWEAESLPPRLLGAAFRLDRGDIIAFTQNGGTVLMQLNEKIEAPLGLKEAEAAIRGRIVQTRMESTRQALLKELRSQAKIEYGTEIARRAADLSGDNSTAMEPQLENLLQHSRVSVVR